MEGRYQILEKRNQVEYVKCLFLVQLVNLLMFVLLVTLLKLVMSKEPKGAECKLD